MVQEGGTARGGGRQEEGGEEEETVGKVGEGERGSCGGVTKGGGGAK